MNNLENLHKIIEKYLKFVHLWYEDNDNSLEEFHIDKFKFYALNNWDCGGFDIVDWYEGTGDYATDGHYKCCRQGAVADLLDFNSACQVIQNIKDFDFYQNEDEEELDYSTPEMVIRNYAYVYLYKLTNHELTKLLSV